MEGSGGGWGSGSVGNGWGVVEGYRGMGVG